MPNPIERLLQVEKESSNVRRAVNLRVLILAESQ